MERKTIDPQLLRRLVWPAAALLFTALTLVYLRPVWQVWQDHIAPVPEDPVFNLYVLKWGVHQIRLGLPHVWDANIYYPLRGALTLSDHLLGPALQLTALETVLPNAIAGYNVLFVTSFIASALATAWVARRSGSSLVAALCAGWMFAFSPFRIQHFNHIQVLLAQWIPLTLWSWDRLLAERTPGNAARFVLFYLLHVTGGCYLAYMIHVPLLVLLLNRAAVHGRALLAPRALRLLVPVALIAAVTLAALFLPYVETSRSQGLVRDPEEIGELGASLASYLSPSTENLYFATPRRGFFRTPLGALAAPLFRQENALFAGFLPTVLALWGLIAWLRPVSGGGAPLPAGRGGDGRGGGGEVFRRALLAALLVTAGLAWLWGDLITLTDVEDRGALPARLGAWGWNAPALLLAVSLAAWIALRWAWRRRLGPLFPADADPWLRGIALSGAACFALTFPVVYVPLARFVPGLDGMRVPARFYAFVSLAVALFAARGIDGLLSRLRGVRARLALGVVLASVLAVELAPRPVNWVPLLREEDFPPVYSWVKQQSDVRAVLELPIRRNWRENAAMYYSTLDWKPIANGYSGYEPWMHRMIADSIHLYPDRRAIDLLRRMGITHILAHVDEIRQRGQTGARELEDFERDLATGPDRELDRVYANPDEEVRVYRILRAPAVPRTG
ncbi:MAG TPA: hypothetical protein VH988_07935 [Thermoanaerobaculia bacterium]|nr:hypothetical protein [Thermoanaerobaculia bacterium]